MKYTIKTLHTNVRNIPFRNAECKSSLRIRITINVQYYILNSFDMVMKHIENHHVSASHRLFHFQDIPEYKSFRYWVFFFWVITWIYSFKFAIKFVLAISCLYNRTYSTLHKWFQIYITHVQVHIFLWRFVRIHLRYLPFQQHWLNWGTTL